MDLNIRYSFFESFEYASYNHCIKNSFPELIWNRSDHPDIFQTGKDSIIASLFWIKVNLSSKVRPQIKEVQEKGEEAIVYSYDWNPFHVSLQNRDWDLHCPREHALGSVGKQGRTKKVWDTGDHQWSYVLLSHLEGNFEMHINFSQHEMNALHNLPLANCSCIF